MPVPHVFCYTKSPDQGFRLRIGEVFPRSNRPDEGWGYAIRRQGSVENVLAMPNRPADALALIGAHYDSVPGTPGADDNASAVAAMLSCAQALPGTGAPSALLPW